jgi:cation transport ATPase
MVNYLVAGNDPSQKNDQSIDRTMLQSEQIISSMPKSKALKHFRVFSIITMILMSCCFIYSLRFAPWSFLPLSTFIFYIIFSFWFAVTHSLIAIIKGTENNIKILKIMGILGLVLYQVAYIVLLIIRWYTIMYDDKLFAYIASISAFLAFSYATVFAFVVISFVKCKVKK